MFAEFLMLAGVYAFRATSETDLFDAVKEMHAIIIKEQKNI
jgi:hypothetical protein